MIKVHKQGKKIMFIGVINVLLSMNFNYNRILRTSKKTFTILFLEHVSLSENNKRIVIENRENVSRKVQ